jgi:lipid-A-disaccharide synthase-like uncharacterized protein
MKISSIVQIVLVNAILIALMVLVREDQLARFDYWSSIGFAGKTVYSILMLRYPATSDHVSIPGLPTLDWVQVFLIVIVLLDVYYLAIIVTGRSDKRTLQTTKTTSTPVPASE